MRLFILGSCIELSRSGDRSDMYSSGSEFMVILQEIQLVDKQFKLRISDLTGQTFESQTIAKSDNSVVIHCHIISHHQEADNCYKVFELM